MFGCCSRQLPKHRTQQIPELVFAWGWELGGSGPLLAVPTAGTSSAGSKLSWAGEAVPGTPFSLKIHVCYLSKKLGGSDFLCLLSNAGLSTHGITRTWRAWSWLSSVLSGHEGTEVLPLTQTIPITLPYHHLTMLFNINSPIKLFLIYSRCRQDSGYSLHLGGGGKK